MINQLNPSSSGPSIYPGEFKPNPFIFETVNEKSSFNVKSAVFSNIKIIEDAENYQIELNTPGHRRENFLVRINEQGNLLISGIHKEDSGFLTEQYNDSTNNYSSFSREIFIPDNVDTDFVRAQCRSGVLSFWFLKTINAYSKRPSIVVVY